MGWVGLVGEMYGMCILIGNPEEKWPFGEC
jgi:hypothetical protein